MSTPTKIPIPGRTESTEKIPTFKNTSKKFKGNKSRTSIQSRKVTNAINNLSSKRIKKNKAKEIRLDSLKVFHPNFTKAKDVIARQSDAKKAHLTFFSGTNKLVLPNQDKESGTKNGLVLSALLHLQIIDNTEGYKVSDGNGGTVCLMVPRQDALFRLPDPNQALVDINKNGGKRLNRGGKRVIGLGCNDEYKPIYQTVGLTPGRCFKGLYDKWPEKSLNSKTRPTLEKMMNVVNTKIGKYIDEHLLLGYKKARDGITHGLKTSGGFKDGNDLLQAAAIGLGAYLNSHTDDDAFLSVYICHCPEEWKENMGYEMDCEPTGYFCFPDQGVAVACRPGDILIFNARKYNHCSSSPTVHYVNKQVFNCSLYIKTLVMAGNNNGE